MRHIVKKGNEIMYNQQQQKPQQKKILIIIVILLLCSGTYVQYVANRNENIFLFEPEMPSVKKSNPTLPIPLDNTIIPEACQGANFQWLASDRSYWDGWTSKSFFMRKDGRFTRRNVQITQDESICVAVLLGPIPAVSSIKHMPHYAPADSITMVAKSQSSGSAIPITLQHHAKQSNAYFASVKFTRHGIWTLETSVEDRSYFWEQPGIHHYRPNQFTSRNSLTVHEKRHNKTIMCNFTEPFALKNSVWVEKEYIQELQHVQFEGANSIFNPTCQFHMDNSCFQSHLTLHMWGDHHLKRNLQHLIGDRPATDMCNEQPYNLLDSPMATTIVHGMTEIHFGGDMDANIVDNHPRWKLDMQLGVSHRLPKADVVVLGVGNLDLANMRQHPNEFAKAFMSLLDYVIYNVYPDQRIIVKTTQYFTGRNSGGLNYGRSQAYANIIRSTVASLPQQEKHRVILWDTHQLGYKENQCGHSLVSHSHVVDIENAILSHLLI